MAPTELWVVRHGATEWSAAWRHTSRTDVALTPAGERAAADVRARLPPAPFDVVLTSPRRRARHTAELAGHPDAIVDDRLVEWDYGDAEGTTTAEMREREPGWSVWTHALPGGESADDVGARCDALLADLGPASGRVLAFSHGHLLRILAARWLDQPAGFGAHLVLTTGCIGVLGWERETPALQAWNT